MERVQNRQSGGVQMEAIIADVSLNLASVITDSGPIFATLSLSGQLGHQ